MAGRLDRGSPPPSARNAAQTGRDGAPDRRLRGFLGRNGDDHPGPKAIWTGLQQVCEFTIALEAGRAVSAGDS